MTKQNSIMDFIHYQSLMPICKPTAKHTVIAWYQLHRPWGIVTSQYFWYATTVQCYAAVTITMLLVDWPRRLVTARRNYVDVMTVVRCIRRVTLTLILLDSLARLVTAQCKVP